MPTEEASDADGDRRQSIATKTRIKGPERQARFLEAAAEIVVESGVSAVTMEEVAARTGVAKRLGYRYFANREALLTRLFEQQIEEATRRAADLMPEQPSFRDHISSNIRAWLELADKHGPLLPRLFSDVDVIPDFSREMGDLALTNWSRSMKDAFGLPLEVAEVLSRIFLSALRGAVDALCAGTASVAEVAEIYTTATYAGAAAVATLAGADAKVLLQEETSQLQR